MLTKQHLLAFALFSSTSVFANVPIESRNLSQSSTQGNTPLAKTAVASNLNWELMQQLQRVENQVRDLRGKIEEQDHQIDQLNKELNSRYEDLDQRLELLKQKVDPTEPTEEENLPETDSAQSTVDAGQSNPPTTPTPINTTTTTTNTIISNTNSSDQVELEKAAYTIALDAYKQGGAKKAIAPMQNFVKNNPNSVYAGNAYFWLAEFNLAIDPPNYDEAKQNYEIVASKFPKSAKASRALYQLYSISKDVNKNTQSAEVYKKKLLESYPDSEEAGYFKIKSS